jgi:hypothetical protein
MLPCIEFTVFARFFKSKIIIHLNKLKEMRINVRDSTPPQETPQSPTSNLDEDKKDTSPTKNQYAHLTQADVSQKAKLHITLSTNPPDKNEKPAHWSDKYKKTRTKFSDGEVLKRLYLQTVHDPNILDFIEETKIHVDQFKQTTAMFRHSVRAIVTLGLGQFAKDAKPGFHLWASDQSPSQVHELMQHYGKGRPWRKDIVVVCGEARSGRKNAISAEKYQFLIMFKPEMVREMIIESPETFLLPKNASKEEIEQRLQDLGRPEYYQELWDESFANNDPDFGLNVDNMVKTMMGWGAQNSEIGTRHAILISRLTREFQKPVTMSEEYYMSAREQFPIIASDIDDLASFGNSRTFLQICEALPKETFVRPEAVMYFDGVTEKKIPFVIDSARRVDAALKQSYENLDSKEIRFVDFTVQDVFSDLFEK